MPEKSRTKASKRSWIKGRDVKGLAQDINFSEVLKRVVEKNLNCLNRAVFSPFAG